MKSRSLSDITDAELNAKEAAARDKLERLASFVSDKFPDEKGRELAAQCRSIVSGPEDAFADWWENSEYGLLDRQNRLLGLAFMAHSLYETLYAAKLVRSAKANEEA